MAKRNQHSVKESLNFDSAGEWDVNAALDISNATAREVAINEHTTHVVVYSDSDVYFRFDTTSGDNVNTSNDVIWPAETLITWRVPRGLGDTIYLHVKQTASAASKSCRVVEV